MPTPLARLFTSVFLGLVMMDPAMAQRTVDSNPDVAAVPFRFIDLPSHNIGATGETATAIGVVSAIENGVRRQAVRESWFRLISPYHTSQGSTQPNTEYRFFIGLDPEGRVSPAVEAEASEYGDIIVVNCPDTFVVSKVIALFRWGARLSGATTLVVRASDDVFIDVSSVLRYMNATTNRARTNVGIYAGYFSHIARGDESPNSDPPGYAQGNAFATSLDLAESIAKHADRSHSHCEQGPPADEFVGQVVAANAKAPTVYLDVPVSFPTVHDTLPDSCRPSQQWHLGVDPAGMRRLGALLEQGSPVCGVQPRGLVETSVDGAFVLASPSVGMTEEHVLATMLETCMATTVAPGSSWRPYKMLSGVVVNANGFCNSELCTGLYDHLSGMMLTVPGGNGLGFPLSAGRYSSEAEEESWFINVIVPMACARAHGRHHDSPLAPRGQLTMIELGAFWAYYSLVAVKHAGRAGLDVSATMLEPSVHGGLVGRENFVANGFCTAPSTSGRVDAAVDARWVRAMICAPKLERVRGYHSQGADSREEEPPCTTVAALMAARGIDELDILHIDIQGAELKALRSTPLDRVNHVVLGTHSPALHRESRELLRNAGFEIAREVAKPDAGWDDGYIHAFRSVLAPP